MRREDRLGEGRTATMAEEENPARKNGQEGAEKERSMAGRAPNWVQERARTTPGTRGRSSERQRPRRGKGNPSWGLAGTRRGRRRAPARTAGRRRAERCPAEGRSTQRRKKQRGRRAENLSWAQGERRAGDDGAEGTRRRGLGTKELRAGASLVGLERAREEK